MTQGLILATFLTCHFGKWRERWHGVSNQSRSGASLLAPVPEENEGLLAAFDANTGQCIWKVTLDTPAGLAITNDRIWVASMHGNRLLCFDEKLDIIDVLSTPLMNDLHSLVISSGGRLMVTSSGVDAVLEVDDGGRLVWDWLATEKGYAYTPDNLRRSIDRRADYRHLFIDTSVQATHCNCALPTVHDGRETVLVSLFHQGKIVAVDRLNGHHKCVLGGLGNPHSIRRRPNGYILCDSRPGNVVLVDENFWIMSIIEHDFSWVQDATELRPGRVLIADANHSRLIEWDIKAGEPRSELRYPEEWKIYQMEIIHGQWEQRIASKADTVRDA
jgi:hypothetical protein